MPARSLMGSRIRERRLDRSIRQVDLAGSVGISASYLNLIEHNRRRIGGKLLADLARALEVEVSALAEGAEAELVARLRDAADAGGSETGAAEVDRAEEFAGRFPGWAALVAAQHGRVRHLEQLVEALSDRLSHDPRLAASLHDVLSTVTAIRSTAAILSDTRDLGAEWLARFHRNLNEDSARLADSAQSLVAYLDGEGDAAGAAGAVSPQDAFEAWLTGRGLHVGELDAGGAVEDVALDGLALSEARDLARHWLEQYQRDALAMPLDQVRVALGEAGNDPAVLAARFAVPVTAAFRRLASLPEEDGAGPLGLIQCDAAGAITFRHAVAGFQLPRLGAPCPLWPLFQALSRPMTPLRQIIEQAARVPQRLVTWSIAEPAGPPSFGQPPLFAAAMLIRPALPYESDPVAQPALPVGTSCRVCPRTACAARREASVLPG